MKIVIAPDSFKGSLTAIQACQAIQAGARRAFPNASFELCPLADGGEGTLDALLTATGGFEKTVRVRGPLGESVEARWGILPDGKAVIEMAQASGLTLVPPEKRDAKAASTWGTGQLIKAALTANCREILVAIGGSATTDGGAGALSALGVRFKDEHDVVLREGGAALINLRSINVKHFDARLERVSFTLLCDVTNPLCGPNGAAHIYGPQKGASPADVQGLDAALDHFASKTRELGRDVANLPGAGAAGGLAFGLMAFCDAKVNSGIETMLEVIDFTSKLEGADLVITGEGSIDAQTLQGKVVAGVCRAARQAGVPVLAFGGKVKLIAQQIEELGVVAAVPISSGEDVEFSMANAAKLLEGAVEAELNRPSE